jgi:hypothetical protein
LYKSLYLISEKFYTYTNDLYHKKVLRTFFCHKKTALRQARGDFIFYAAGWETSGAGASCAGAVS